MRRIGRALCWAGMHRLSWELDRVMLVEQGATATHFYVLRCERAGCRRILSFTRAPRGFGWRS